MHFNPHSGHNAKIRSNEAILSILVGFRLRMPKAGTVLFVASLCTLKSLYTIKHENIYNLQVYIALYMLCSYAEANRDKPKRCNLFIYTGVADVSTWLQHPNIVIQITQREREKKERILWRDKVVNLFIVQLRSDTTGAVENQQSQTMYTIFSESFPGGATLLPWLSRF